ncbi:MAG: DUF748 domain-containing protein [Desulfonatronovibrionaceae bacterium]
MGKNWLKNPFPVWKESGRAAKAAVILASIYLVYVLAGFFLIPEIVRSDLQKRVSRLMDRETEIAEAGFNPFTLEFSIRGVRIGKKDKKGDLFSADLLQANLELASVFRRALVIKEFRAITPALDIAFYGEGRYSISDLIPPKKDTSDSDSGEKEIFPFMVRDIAIKNASLRFKDEPRQTTHVVDRFNFVLPHISSRLAERDRQTRPRLDFRINGDPVDLNAQMLPFASSRESRLQLDFKRMDLGRYWIYSPLADRLNLERGELSAELVLEFQDTDEGIRIDLSGESSLDNILLTDKNGTEVLECELARAELQRYSPLARILEMDKVELGKTRIKISRDKEETVNWVRYLAPEPKDKDAAETAPDEIDPEAPGISYVFREIDLPEMEIEFADSAASSYFERGLGMSARIRDLTSQTGKNGTAIIRAKGSGGERLEVNASLLPAEKEAGAHIDFSTVPLAEYSPYFRKYLPWKTRSVNLSGSMDLAFNPGGKNNLQVSRGRLKLDRVRMDRSNGSSLLDVDTLLAEGIALDTQEKTVLVQEAELRNGNVQLLRLENGSLDVISDLRDQYPKEEAAPDSDPSEKEPWKVQVPNIRVRGVRTAFNDLKAPEPAQFVLDTDRLDINGLSLPGQEEARFHFNGRVNRGGSISADGDFSLSPFRADINGRAEDLDLTTANSYLPKDIRLDIRNCLLSADFNTYLKQERDFSLAARANCTLASLDVRDSHQNKLVRLERMDINRLSLGIDPNELHISEIMLKAPGLDLERDLEGKLNLQKALGIQKDKNSSSERPPGIEKKEPFFQNVQVDRVEIKNGTLFFRDKSVSPYYETELTAVDCTAASLSRNMDNPGRLSLNATKDEYSRLVLSGEINPLAKKPHSELEFSLQGMDMVSLTPYTLNFMAYPIKSGKLNWNGSFQLQNSTLKGENLFLIQNLKLGPRVDNPDAANVPIKLALALLQDSRDDLELDIPISGNLKDPQFSLGKTIFRAVIGLFSKVATAPFALIGNLFGGGEDVNHIPFQPGEYTLPSEAADKLDSIIEALQKRPRLRVSVTGRTARDKDRAALVKKRFLRRLRLEKIKDMDREKTKTAELDLVSISEEEYPEYLKKAYKTLRQSKDQDLPRPGGLSETEMENRLRAQLAVTDEDLQELALDRARSVRTYITKQDPELAKRVFLLHGGGKASPGKAEAVLSIK